jgi:hypothetical protein
MALRAQRARSLAQKTAEYPTRKLKAPAHQAARFDRLAKKLSDSCDEIKNSNRLLKELITPPLRHLSLIWWKALITSTGIRWVFEFISNKRNNFQTIHIGQANFK